MEESTKLIFTALGGAVVELDAMPEQSIAELKKRLANVLGGCDGVRLQLLCGDQLLKDEEKVAGLPEKHLQVLRSFSASLCTVSVDGIFPADPRDYFEMEGVGEWPRACHCARSREDELRQLLAQKTKLQVSATHANLAEVGLQPDLRMPIAAVMRFAERIEKRRLDAGEDFKLKDGCDLDHVLKSGDFTPLIDLCMLSEDEALQFDHAGAMDKEKGDLFSCKLWKLQGKLEIDSMQYLSAREFLEHAWREQKDSPWARVKRQLSAEALSRAPTEQQSTHSPCLLTFRKFKEVFGDAAQAEWETAGAIGINDEERDAVAQSQSILAQVEAILQEPIWESYALRFDLDIANRGCSKDADPTVADGELDLLLRYMAFGMSTTQTSFTLAHHCSIDRSELGRIRVTLQGLAHPANSNKRKGLFGRSRKWWQQCALRPARQFDSGWQMVWRFAQHLRELSGGGARRVDRFQLRWRTVCKAIKSRTLRRCGVPASSSWSSTDEISSQYKFLFFEGSEGLVDAKRELLFNLRCRRVGFSRLPSRQALAEKPDPYACDVHFSADDGVPLAWMWGLNVSGNMCEDICRSSGTEESSTAELRRHIRNATSSKCPWPQISVPRSDPEDWPKMSKIGIDLDRARTGVCDTEGSNSETDSADSSDDDS